MSYNQGTQLTLERSKYPKRWLFKPVKRPDVTTPAQAFKVFMELLAQPVPPTEEEKAYARNWPVSKQTAGADFDDGPEAWDQCGIYWVRRTRGSNPECRTSDRVGAHAIWRNAEGCYSCAGFPTFYPETMERFRREMEMTKPVMLCPNFPGKLLISLQRTLDGPAGTCWGIKTGQMFWRLQCGDLDYAIPRTKAELKRKLKRIYELHAPVIRTCSLP